MTPLDIARVREAFPGRVIEYYDRVDSTMNAAAGRAVGAVVIAGEQTAGQGRHGHSWHSEPGAGIYCSIVLRPGPVLTLALGLATAEAIREATGIACDLRWPNDVMVEDKKVAGILVQAAGDKAVAGIGINVSQKSFPPELEAEATSLELAAPPPSLPSQAPREAGHTEVVLALLSAVDSYTALDKDSILKLFTEASSYARGRRVVVEQPDGIVEGTTAGLDPSGFLIVRRDDGTDTLILTGGVRAAGS